MTTLTLPDLTCPKPEPHLTALWQAGNRGGPVEGPVSTRTNTREKARHAWEQRCE